MPDNIKIMGQFIPMRMVLKQVFEIPGILTTCINYITEQSSLSEPLMSILQGQLWKDTTQLISQRHVIPFVLYFDDFEVCNPLGSSSGIHKLVLFTTALLECLLNFYHL